VILLFLICFVYYYYYYDYGLILFSDIFLLVCYVDVILFAKHFHQDILQKRQIFYDGDRFFLGQGSKKLSP